MENRRKDTRQKRKEIDTKEWRIKATGERKDDEGREEMSKSTDVYGARIEKFRASRKCSI